MGVGVGWGSAFGEGRVLNPESHAWEAEFLPKAAYGLARERETTSQPFTPESRLCFVSPCVFPSKRRNLSTESGSESPSSVLEAPIGT